MKVALYSRVSTQEQALNGNSIHEQETRMGKYCDAMKWESFRNYTDAGYSGATMKRPALQQLIKDVKKGKIDKVLVYKLDRLSRSQLDTLYLIEKIFLENETDFVSMNENFDTATPFGRAMIGILAVFAQLEREQIKERMMMGKEARAKKGLYHGSNCSPIGYDYKDGELKTNEYEKMQIEKIFDDYIQGKSPQTISDELNEKGYTTKYGKWNDCTVRKVLQRKTYLGFIKYHDEYYKGEHEPLITKEIFEAAQKIYKKRRDEYSFEKEKSGNIQSYLGGLIHCGNCESKYIKVHSQYRRNGGFYEYNYYRCNLRNNQKRYINRNKNKKTCRNKTWKMDTLNELVFDEIRKLALDPKYLDKATTDNEYNKKTNVLKTEIQNLENQMNKLMDLYSINQMPLDTLQKKIQDVNAKKIKQENELEKLEHVKDQNLSKDEALQYINSLDDVLKNGDFDQIREVVTSLIEKIVVYNEDVHIYWRFN